MVNDFIPVTFDKSHLLTIGTRLYSESLDLIRELVANAYDADATWVKISLLEDGLIVEDNGEGMDREGLKQYFTVGSPFKKINKTSHKFKRVRIGEFGIGKFALLSLCNRFELFTKKDGYAATVIFDKDDFEQTENWQVPLIEHTTTYKRSGTRVTLQGLKRQILSQLLERKLQEQIPLAEKSFNVYIDGVQLLPKYIPGRRFRIRQQTEFGSIHGKIIISSLILPKEQMGIGIRVKKMLIKREYFGLDEKHEVGKKRITGVVNADFLPLTSARDNFITDSPQYTVFQQAIDKKIKQVASQLRKNRNIRQDTRANRALSEALKQVKRAIRKNKEIFLLHDLPLFSKETEKSQIMAQKVSEGFAMEKVGTRVKAAAQSTKLPGKISRKLNKKTRERVKTVLKDKNRLVKKIKIGGANIVCNLAHLGKDEVESFTEGGVIFINRDHPLFVKTAKQADLSSLYLLRLITQEIALLTQPTNPRAAFEIQSRLLTDAYS